MEKIKMINPELLAGDVLIGTAATADKNSVPEKNSPVDLRDLQQVLQNYLDDAMLGQHWVDSNGIILWANKAELNMLGYSKAEYVGHHISEFHKNKKKIEEILLRLSANEEI